jgi:hypothetical protein
VADRQRLLTIYLRLYAGLLLLALPGSVAPTPWLSWAYTALGLGSWPKDPLVGYLARSLSGLYAFVGGIVLIASFDPPRYRPILVYLAASSLVGSIYLTVLDLCVGLPVWWVAGEGPIVMLSGVLLYVLIGPAK